MGNYVGLIFRWNLILIKMEKNSENPVSIEKMSEKTLRQTNGIVAFNIHINEIQAAYKLSQNRDDANYHSIIEQLENTEDINAMEVAKEMKKRRNTD